MYNFEKKKKVSFWDKWDHPYVGLVMGFLIPIIAFVALCSTKYIYHDIHSFIEVLLRKYKDPVILKASVFPNLPVFLFFNIIKKHRICNGIFFASLVFIIPMLVIRYL